LEEIPPEFHEVKYKKNYFKSTNSAFFIKRFLRESNCSQRALYFIFSFVMRELARKTMVLLCFPFVRSTVLMSLSIKNELARRSNDRKRLIS